jgi:hypothetical protein
MSYTDEELDNILGGAQKTYTKFRTLVVDNGIDTMGSLATGNFIEKGYDKQENRVTRDSYADIFTGVIIAQRAQLVDKSKSPTWQTAEFDPSNKLEQIAIYPLDKGKWIKNADGSFQVKYGIYDDIKNSRRVANPDGTFTSTFHYNIILYIGVNDDVLKLKFKGTSRANYFDYGKLIAKLQAKPHNLNTKFSTYTDKSTGKYAVKFEIEVDDQGIMTQVNADQVREWRIKVAQSFMNVFGGKSLSAPVGQKQIEQPEIPYDPEHSDTNDDVDYSQVK